MLTLNVSICSVVYASFFVIILGVEREFRKFYLYHFYFLDILKIVLTFRDGSRTAATSKMEGFVITVNGFQPLTIITKRSILDVVAALDPPPTLVNHKKVNIN